MKILKLREPIAKKEHKCMLCGGVINKGEQYKRQTCIYNGSIYDLVCHSHCSFLASKLDMYDYCDDGLDGEAFKENIRTEYQDIMQSKFSEIYESKEFSFPVFSEQLNFVKKYHNCALFSVCP